MAKIVYLCVLLTGCATSPAPQYRWHHDSGADRVQFERDFGQCEAQALGTHPRTSHEQAVSLLGACLRGKGWRLVER